MSDNPISKKDILNLLIKERDHHFEHAHQINRRVIFSIASSISGFLLAFIFREQLGIRLSEMPSAYIVILFCLMAIGYLCILWGLSEHSKIHSEQRKCIEKAIKFMLTSDVDFDTKEFWKIYGANNLKYMCKKTLEDKTFLIAAEPDNRSFWKYHDRKIELGIGFLLVGFAVFVFKFMIHQPC